MFLFNVLFKKNLGTWFIYIKYFYKLYSYEVVLFELRFSNVDIKQVEEKKYVRKVRSFIIGIPFSPLVLCAEPN